MNPLALALARLFFLVTSRIMPFVAVGTAERLFTTPPFSRRRDIEKELLNAGEQFPIPYENSFDLAGYRWGKKSDPIVLFVHGWTSTATCFLSFIDALVGRNYQCISFDLVAHGNSPGKTIMMTQAADSLVATLRCIGPVDCIVGHSMGAGATVIASSLGLDTRKIVLISPATDIVDVTERFAKTLCIPQETMAKVRQYAWEKYDSASKYGKDWVDIFNSDCSKPTLIVHDKDDKEISVKNARRLVKQWPKAQLMETERLGHRRILLSPDVVNAVTEFVETSA